MTKNDITYNHWGTYFGYPACCITEFIQDAKTLIATFTPDYIPEREALQHERLNRKLSGTGYIPCKACNAKSEGELVETINKNRLARLPFPKQGKYGDDIEHLISVLGSK